MTENPSCPRCMLIGIVAGIAAFCVLVACLVVAMPSRVCAAELAAPHCRPLADLETLLAVTFGERLVASGAIGDGPLTARLYGNAANGSWSFVVVYGPAVGCVRAYGERFAPVVGF